MPICSSFVVFDAGLTSLCWQRSALGIACTVSSAYLTCFCVQREAAVCFLPLHLQLLFRAIFFGIFVLSSIFLSVVFDILLIPLPPTATVTAIYKLKLVLYQLHLRLHGFLCFLLSHLVSSSIIFLTCVIKNQFVMLLLHTICIFTIIIWCKEFLVIYCFDTRNNFILILE